MGDTNDEIEDVENMHQIQNKYTFWYRANTGNAAKTVNYNDSIKKMASFQTVEHFWRIYDYMKRPSDLNYTEYHMFKEGITPTWEDSANKLGGKWMIRLKKGIASRYWEDAILAIIGEQFDVGSEVCGAVLSVRSNEDIISIWNKTADNTEAVNKIRDQLRRVLRLPTVIAIEYKRHQDSLVDRSSYRNPTMVWRAPSRQTEDRGVGQGHKGSYGGSYNRTHDAGAPGHPKQGWKPNRHDGAGTGAGGVEGGPRNYWTKPGGEVGNRGRADSGDAKAGAGLASSGVGGGAGGGGGGWARGQGLAAAASGVPAKKAAVAPPVPAAGSAQQNAWARKGPTI